MADNVTPELKQVVEASSEEIRLEEAPTGLALGDDRNFAVARANGRYVCQWDDDDFYHRDRITAMMTVLLEGNVEAVFLNRWMLWWPERQVLAISQARLWEGSMLAKRSAVRIYPATGRGEDTRMVDAMAAEARLALLDAPHL